jgi:hypothetical protein
MPVDDMPIDTNVDQLQIDADDVIQDGNEGGETTGPSDDDEGGESKAYPDTEGGDTKTIVANDEQSRSDSDNNSSEHDVKADHAPHNDEGGKSKAPNNNEGDEGGETNYLDNKEADNDDLSEPSPGVSSFVPCSEEDEMPGTTGQTQLPRPELLDAVGEPRILQPITSPIRSPRHAHPPTPPTHSSHP